MAEFFSIPNVTIKRNNASFFSNGLNLNAAVLVAPMFKGPEVPTLVTSLDQLKSLYAVGDNPSLDWGMGLHSAAEYFRYAGFNSSRSLLIKRIVKSSAAFAGGVFYNSGFSNPATPVTSGYTPFKFGTVKGYATGTRQLLVAALSGALITGNIISVTLNNGTTTKVIQTTFATDSNATINAFVDAINSQINWSNGPGTSPGGAQARASSGTTLNEIAVLCPEGVVLTLDSFAIASGASQATITVQQASTLQPKLMEVFAENRGAWGSDIGIGITDISNGTHQQTTLTFGGSLSSGHSATFNLTYGNKTMVIVGTYAASHAATMAQLASDIQTAFGGVPGTAMVTGANVITIISPVVGVSTFAVSPVVMAGSTPPTCTVVTTAGTAGLNTFTLNVYTRANTAVPVESFNVSFDANKIDNFGRSQYIENVVNSLAGGSRYIRIKHNTSNPLGKMMATVGTQINWLNGGDDSSMPTNSEIATGYEELKDRAKYDFRYIINAGYTNAVVQAKIIEVAETRADCMFFLDVPSASVDPTSAATWKRTTLGSTSTFGAAFAPWLNVPDLFTNKEISLPPSGAVAARAADSFANAYFKSFAGLNRGGLPQVRSATYNYSEAEMSVLSKAQINGIGPMSRSSGFIIRDQLTLADIPSALSYLNVRMIMINIETLVMDVLPTYLQESYSSSTLYAMQQAGERILEPAKGEGAIKAYQWICDENLNTPSDEDAGTVKIYMRIDPVRAVRHIELTSEVTRAGAINTAIS